MKDFFVSYNKADRAWAEWVAWQLEEAGYTTIIQAWDFRPGSNFVLKMQEASAKAEKTIAILSRDYLNALYTHPEWAAAFAQDPTGTESRLLPVRVRECETEGLLGQIVYIDLVGLDEEKAKGVLLEGVVGQRAKPTTAPAFPGKRRHSVEKPERFPGYEAGGVPKKSGEYETPQQRGKGDGTKYPGEGVATTQQRSPVTARDGTQRRVGDDRVRVATLESMYSVLTGSPSPVFWTGGGASIKSGIPLSEGLVEKAAKWEYCRREGRSFDDPGVLRSDYMKWFNSEFGHVTGALADKYQYVMRHLLRPRDNRREFFRRVLDTNIPASSGYDRLAEFMALGFVMTSVTTNFDMVLPELCHRRRRPHYVDVVESPSTHRLLTTSPRYPLVAYLYGSIEDYIDRFEDDEARPVDQALVQRLTPLLRDHPLIVAGYRGAEEVIMRGLLIEQAEVAEHYHRGVYWCVQNYRTSDDLHPMVQEFASLVRGNFQVIPIEGFDEMMERLWELHQRHQHRPTIVQVQAPPVEEPGAPTFDMRVVEADLERELDWPSMKTRLVNYYDVWEMALPDVVTREWLVEELCRQHLAVNIGDGRVTPTIAGYLLFGRKPHEKMPSSVTVLRVGGEEERHVEGGLWTQLASIMDALAEVNKPFLLKGEKSETVYPYPPTALREVVVNALVHREYDSRNSVVVEIEPDWIRITNPGGLVEDVIRQTEGDSILRQIEQGARGIKGYRNPVIADLFYSSHDMEKAGSGLADVHRLVRENGGKVTFGPMAGNTAFEVVIHSRPEAVDRRTGTAAVVVSTRYAANLLEVAELPARVWQAPTEHRHPKDVWANTDAPWLPPFLVHAQHIYTFFDLSMKANPLREVVDTRKVNWQPVDEFAAKEDGERRLVWLMNECLHRHLKARGLAVDYRRKRAYFSRTEEGKRAIAYQARLRRSTRTVTKPVISPTTQQIRYWEHQAFSYMFERFADIWALQILPGYVFTRDGARDLLSGERVNILSTKRASRDYNSKVHTDLVFWTWVLSGGEQGSFALQMGPSPGQLERARQLVPPPSKRQKAARNADDISVYTTAENVPGILIKASLPTLTVYNLEEASEEDDAGDDQESAERVELEDELAALAEEFEEQFED
jgi:hypothetical protein